MAKSRGATLVLSRIVAERIGGAAREAEFDRVAIEGIERPMDVIVLRTPDEAARMLAAEGPGSDVS